MKRIKYILLCLVMASVLLTGCKSKTQVKKDDISIYYISPESSALESKTYKMKETKQDKQIEEILAQLKKFSTTASGKLKVTSYEVKERNLELHFNQEYSKMQKSAEVFVRAAIVQTMVQIPGIEYVSFYIENEPLKDYKGEVIGMMSADSFVQNTGSSLYSYQRTSLKLYFSDEAGTAVRGETRDEVRYGINTSMEKLVVEQLMKGPKSKECEPTIPEATKLLGVSVKDGICYVNFSSAFLTNGYNQKPEVTIYSIVNSIVENGNVLKVQILVEGANDAVFMNTIDLSKPLEKNMEIVKE